MDVKEPDLSGSYTYADYLTWEWDQMSELIHGKIFKMSPAPSDRHQQISGNLFGPLWNYLRGKKCQVRSAPFDVRLPGTFKSDRDIVTVVQPDICLICEPSKIELETLWAAETDDEKRQRGWFIVVSLISFILFPILIGILKHNLGVI